MGTLRKQIFTRARSEQVWDAVRDIGALHTRLVPGFVSDTRLQPGARLVTFANGVTALEPIVTIDGAEQRLVWTVKDLPLFSHYNASAQVFAEPGGSRVVWTADFLPDSARAELDALMEAGARAMQAALDRLAAAAVPT
jgi:hypothetical protein